MSGFQETDKMIWRSFFKLLETSSFESITINEICTSAKISRTTFYRHYEDKYQLLDTVNRDFASSLANYLQKRIYQTNISDSLVAMAKFLSQNAQVIVKLLKIHTPESDLHKLFKEVLYTKFTDYIHREQAKGAVTAFPITYLTELYVAISMVFLSYSLESGLDINIVRSLDNFQRQIFTEKPKD